MNWAYTLSYKLFGRMNRDQRKYSILVVCICIVLVAATELKQVLG